MPSPASQVGPLPIVAPVDGAQGDFPDPTTDYLLDYIRFWLRYGLNTKAATMTAPPVTDAVPLANAYPHGPSDLYLKRALPALFVYWNGASKVLPYSTMVWLRVREFNIVYAYERVVNSDNAKIWRGLISNVDAILCKAFVNGQHPAYSYDGLPAAPGTHIRFMFNWHGVEFQGGKPGALKELPQESLRKVTTAAGRAGANRAEGGIQSFYPSYGGTIHIYEQIFDDVLTAADLTTDMRTKINGTDGAGESILVEERFAEGVDGTEPSADFPVPNQP